MLRLIMVLLIFSGIVNSHSAETSFSQLLEQKKFSHQLRDIILTDNKGNPNEIFSKLLEKQADEFKKHDDFSTPEDYERSLKNWNERCQYLKAAMKLGSLEAKKNYEKELESKKYGLECYDCLIVGYEDEIDPKLVLSFYWEQVAQEIPEERIKLDQAYKDGMAKKLND